MLNSTIFWPLYTQMPMQFKMATHTFVSMSKMCNIKMTKTLNYSITIPGATKPITIIYLVVTFKTVLFYCLAS